MLNKKYEKLTFECVESAFLQNNPNGTIWVESKSCYNVAFAEAGKAYTYKCKNLFTLADKLNIKQYILDNLLADINIYNRDIISRIAEVKADIKGYLNGTKKAESYFNDIDDIEATAGIIKTLKVDLYNLELHLKNYKNNL